MNQESRNEWRRLMRGEGIASQYGDNVQDQKASTIK